MSMDQAQLDQLMAQMQARGMGGYVPMLSSALLGTCGLPQGGGPAKVREGCGPASSYTGACRGSRYIIPFSQSFPISSSGEVEITSDYRCFAAALVVFDIGANLDTTAWSYGNVQLFPNEPQLNGASVTSTIQLSEFTRASLEAGINLLPARVSEIYQAQNLVISITNGNAAAAESVSGALICWTE